jgi:hypothetical protein
VLRSRLAVLAAVVTGASLLVVAPAGAAPAQQVCDSSSFGGGEVCFYAGPHFTGTEFDLSVPLGEQLPLANGGDCTDLPTGIGLAGSITNASTDTLYIVAVSCPDTHPGTVPAAVIRPRFSGDITADTEFRANTHSVRMCGPGLVFNPIALTCDSLG